MLAREAMSIEDKLAIHEMIAHYSYAYDGKDVDAFAEVIQRGGGVGQILTELAVLTAYGVILLAAGAALLRRAIVG